MNAVNQLRQQQLANSQQSFKARGSHTRRCECCLQAQTYCISPWQLRLNTAVNFILLMHPKEPYKSSNTGRLIAELFPQNTQALIWSRTDMPMDFIEQTQREPNLALLYPAGESDKTVNIAALDRPLSVILLDGTWKQAARMARLSPYLQQLPKINLEIPEEHDYLRTSQTPQQASTAHAAAELLHQLGENDNSAALKHYVTLLNEHTRAARDCRPITLGKSHEYLSQRQSLKGTK